MMVCAIESDTKFKSQESTKWLHLFEVARFKSSKSWILWVQYALNGFWLMSKLGSLDLGVFGLYNLKYASSSS